MTKATKDLYMACPNIFAKVDQNFFITNSASNAVFHGEPFVMAAWMEKKVLPNSSCLCSCGVKSATN